MSKKFINSDFRVVAWALGASFAALLVSYCGTKTEDIAATATFSSLYTSVFQGCNKCHVPTNETYSIKNVKLDFSSKTTAYTSLTSAQPAGTLTEYVCTNAKYVDTANKTAAHAMIWPYLTASETDVDAFKAINPDCGINVVTHEKLNLTSAQLALVKQWIEAGSQNN